MPARNPLAPVIDEHLPDWPKGLYRRGNSFRFRRLVKGRHYQRIFGQVALDRAIQLAQRWNLDLAEGLDPQGEERRRICVFKEFAYDEWLKAKQGGLRPSSYDRYRVVVDSFQAFLDKEFRKADVRLGDITLATANKYVSTRRQAPVVPNGSRKYTRPLKGAAKKTLHFERAVLKQLFESAVEAELIAKNPFADVEAPAPKLDEIRAAHHPLNEDEAQKLITAAEQLDRKRGKSGDARLADIVQLMLLTGLREEELRLLEWSDVNQKEGSIKLQTKPVREVRRVSIPANLLPHLKKLAADKPPEASLFPSAAAVGRLGHRLAIRTQTDLLALKVKDLDLTAGVINLVKEFTWQPKATQGVVPLCAKAKALLKRLEAEKRGQFVFGHHDGGSCRLRLLDLLKEAQKEAGIPGRLRVHDLRHTFAVRLRRKGVPVETIMGLMRHKNIEETLIYTPYFITEGARAILKLDED